jgi:hypothetical protein
VRERESTRSFHVTPSSPDKLLKLKVSIQIPSPSLSVNQRHSENM